MAAYTAGSGILYYAKSECGLARLAGAPTDTRAAVRNVAIWLGAKPWVKCPYTCAARTLGIYMLRVRELRRVIALSRMARMSHLLPRLLMVFIDRRLPAPVEIPRSSASNTCSAVTLCSLSIWTNCCATRLLELITLVLGLAPFLG